MPRFHVTITETAIYSAYIHADDASQAKIIGEEIFANAENSANYFSRSDSRSVVALADELKEATQIQKEPV